MANLIRMDLYRMNKGKAFCICLILAFLFALASAPLEALLYKLGQSVSAETAKEIGEMKATISLPALIGNPISTIGIMLALLSCVSFFHADMEAGYIKNIAGQMPRRGFSILSRFIASIPHNATFMLAALIGSVTGNLMVRKVILDGSVPEAVGLFLLRLLLLQGVTAIILLVAASFRNKSLGILLAVLMGMPLLELTLYSAINVGLSKLFSGFGGIDPYMPDVVLRETNPPVLRAFLVAAVTIAVFLPLAIRIFDHKDVK